MSLTPLRMPLREHRLAWKCPELTLLNGAYIISLILAAMVPQLLCVKYHRDKGMDGH